MTRHFGDVERMRPQEVDHHPHGVLLTHNTRFGALGGGSGWDSAHVQSKIQKHSPHPSPVPVATYGLDSSSRI